MSGSEGGVYFLSRSELLAWVNNLLQLNYTKVEECSSGALQTAPSEMAGPRSTGNVEREGPLAIHVTVLVQCLLTQ